MNYHTEIGSDPEEERLIERGKIIVLVKMALIGVLLLIILGILLFIFVEPPGEVYISSNVKDATIIIDTVPTEYYTDTLIKEISPGEHLFTVNKEGYTVSGNPIIRLKITPGGTDSLHFELIKEN